MTAPSASLGKTIAVRVMATDREANLVALSRKAALEEMSERTLKTLREGQVRTATIRTALQYGAIADIGGVTAWLPAREREPGWRNTCQNRRYLSSAIRNQNVRCRR